MTLYPISTSWHKVLSVTVISLALPCVSLAASQALHADSSTSATTRIAGKAKEWFRRFQTGRIDRSQLSSQTNAQLTDDMILQEAAQLKALGNPTSFSFVRSYTIDGARGYDFLWTFKGHRVIEMIAFDADGKIAGIDFEIFDPVEGQPGGTPQR